MTRIGGWGEEFVLNPLSLAAYRSQIRATKPLPAMLSLLSQSRAYSLVISCQPNGGEMTPTEFPDYEISSIREGVTYMDWMITAFTVILEILLIFSHD